MLFKLVSLSLLAALACAQDTSVTSTSPLPSVSISPCILNCLQSATGCDSYTDLSCVCTNTTFQTSAAACIQSNCPASDLQAALALQAAECAAISSTSSKSSGSTTTTTSHSSATSSASLQIPGSLTSELSSTTTTTTHSSVGSSHSSSGTSPSSSSAAVGIMPRDNGWLKTVGVVVIGVVGGGLLVL